MAAYFVAAQDDLVLGNRSSGAEYRAAEAQLRDPGVKPEVAVGSALTNLSLIETRRPRLGQRADALENQIVAQGETFHTAQGKPYETTAAGGPPTSAYASHIVHLGGLQASPTQVTTCI